MAISFLEDSTSARSASIFSTVCLWEASGGRGIDMVDNLLERFLVYFLIDHVPVHSFAHCAHRWFPVCSNVSVNLFGWYIFSSLSQKNSSSIIVSTSLHSLQQNWQACFGNFLILLSTFWSLIKNKNKSTISIYTHHYHYSLNNPCLAKTVIVVLF